MATEASSRKMDWLLFIVSTIVFFAMLVFVPQWFWVVIPFPLTYLVRALNVI